MFFKRRNSRSRANSYIDQDQDQSPPRSKDNSNYDSYDKYDSRPDSQHNQQTNTRDIASPPEKDMYSRQHQQQPQEPYLTNGGHNALPLHNGPPPTMNAKAEPMPDLLAQAFNAAVRPYTEKIDNLEAQVADMQSWIEQMERERAELHAWIDKRGLRPDVPPTIAKIMDATTPDAPLTLNGQLDRKITIVNFDLHRLQDDLNDSISSAHFASAMLKFLPDIARLASLPGGPKLAFDLILKLGGNLNSHGGIDPGDPEDLAARRDFYGRLDGAMVECVGRRFQEGEEWAVGREIKRIEKTAAYLKAMGIEPYFAATLELMRREVEMGGGGALPQQQQNLNGSSHRISTQGGAGTPPRYQ
ncbi:uncharacterized protein BDZ99DRAFT_449471 [Mytilinidion resinicola]|uniref:Uncharacterized protein n=1 Tax=Mytilinidion resinicola TaxID=574789 RepID=A0A6A6YCH8_9PEZI|nr:uncharacterized protein BDZ99DRAFT_449471 [Mytilinidion resinicola]KAF2805805.1 hypothetical protein BDZ99DRAFT_449471 [Mytilinidion resinicola]